MKLERFDITPEGIRPNLIGKPRAETDAALGEGRSSNQGILRDEEGVIYAGVYARAAFRDGRAVEIGFAPPAPVYFRSQCLFDHPKLWRDIAAMDGDARESLGFIILPNLGITLTGFHDEDRSQLALTAFEQGRWDDLNA